MAKKGLLKVNGGFSKWSKEDIQKYADFMQQFWKNEADAERCRFIDLYSVVDAAFVMDTTLKAWYAINETDWWSPMCDKYRFVAE